MCAILARGIHRVYIIYRLLYMHVTNRILPGVRRPSILFMRLYIMHLCEYKRKWDYRARLLALRLAVFRDCCITLYFDFIYSPYWLGYIFPALMWILYHANSATDLLLFILFIKFKVYYYYTADWSSPYLLCIYLFFLLLLYIFLKRIGQ